MTKAATGGTGGAIAAEATIARCARCGSSFRCGAVEGSVECWCVAEPHVPVNPELQGCLCRTCLIRLATPVA